MSNKPPITSEEIPPEWSIMVGEILRRDGQAMRAHFTLPMIEIKCLQTSRWLPLTLFGSGTMFVTVADRDEVIKRILE